jgi:hypothetical protein
VEFGDGFSGGAAGSSREGGICGSIGEVSPPCPQPAKTSTNNTINEIQRVFIKTSLNKDIFICTIYFRTLQDIESSTRFNELASIPLLQHDVV